MKIYIKILRSWSVICLVGLCSLGTNSAAAATLDLKAIAAVLAGKIYCLNNGTICKNVTFISPIPKSKPVLAICQSALIAYFNLTSGSYPSCYIPSCGDGKIQQPGEKCEPTLSSIPHGSCNVTSCQINCNSGFHIVGGACVQNCGNNQIESPEACDGTNTPANSACAPGCDSFTCNSGFEKVGGACVIIAPRHAYISNFNDSSVSLCNVEADGTLSSCATTPAVSPFAQPVGIVINGAGDTAYTANYSGNYVNKCTINLTDGTLSSCIDSNNSGNAFSRPFGITLNAAGNTAYVVNNEAYDDGNFAFDDPVLKCPINPDGTFGACANALSSPGVGVLVGTRPVAIALNSAGTIAYVLNDRSSGAVFKCPVNADGTFGDCVDSGNSGLPFAHPLGIVLNNAGNIAYVTNQSDYSVRKCPINPDGSFGACVDATGVAGIFNNPIGITLNRAGTFAYIANWGNSTVTKCAVDLGGTLGACGPVGSGFSGAFWVTLAQ